MTTKVEEREPLFHYHHQNLNENRNGDIKGTILRHGRAWLRTGRTTWGWSWQIPTYFCHIEFEHGGCGDYDISFGFACYLFAFWFHVENLIPWTVKKKWDKNHWWWNGRETYISIHDQSIYIKLFADQDSWSATDPWWMHITIHPIDLIFGKEKYTNEVLSEHETFIPMPEGNYPCTIKIEKSTWSRKWGIRPKVRIGADVKIPGGISIPGKAENDWDCGDDGIFGCGADTDNVDKARVSVVKQVLDARIRYACLDWVPIEGWKVSHV